jgi:hypothetical protein
MPYRLSVAFLLIFSMFASQSSLAEGFSIDAASPGVPNVSQVGLLSAGPVGGPPVEFYVFPIAPTDEVNAITWGTGSPDKTFHFSVDRSSVGLAGDVVTEAAAGHAAGDLYATNLLGTNALALNQRDLGLVPTSLPGVPSPSPIDNVDAYEFAPTIAGSLIVYSLRPGHSLLGTAVGCGGDIFYIGTMLFFGYPTLGLGSCLDDVDAFEVDSTGNIRYYSLAPGSPSLAPGSLIIGCSAGCSPADIFAKGLMPGAAYLFASAADLGLLASDNVDALAMTVPDAPIDYSPQVPIPALGSGGLALLACLLAGAMRLWAGESR